MLKNKSDENFNAALLLEANAYLNSYIHCQYYGCVQLIKYIVIREKYSSQEAQFDSASKNSGTASHQFIINEILGLIRIRARKKTFEFSQNINKLKGIRVKADYKEKLIDNSDVIECKSKVIDIVKVLNTIFVI